MDVDIGLCVIEPHEAELTIAEPWREVGSVGQTT